MEPTEALESIETALRLAIRHVLGDHWLGASGAPTEQALLQRQASDDNRRDGVVVSKDLLSYAYTRELTDIIETNWSQFEPVFGDGQRTLAYFGNINDVRNAIAHARDLVPFERDLISGIAGQLRNQVSIYRSTGINPSSRYYPLIESLTDSFGTEGRSEQIGYTRTARRLDIGQVLTFTGRAFNATGRSIKWYVASTTNPSSIGHSYINVGAVVAEGDSVTFQYTITESDVGETFGVIVHIVTEARFHRYGNFFDKSEPYDDGLTFRYSVNPPDED